MTARMQRICGVIATMQLAPQRIRGRQPGATTLTCNSMGPPVVGSGSTPTKLAGRAPPPTKYGFVLWVGEHGSGRPSEQIVRCKRELTVAGVADTRHGMTCCRNSYARCSILST